MVAYCLLALIASLPCPHRVSIGFNFGDRFGNHNSVIPSASRREALAVWQGSSSSNRATCQPRQCDRTSPRNAWKSPLRPFWRGKNNRVPVRRFITPKITRRALRPLSQTLATSPRFDQAARNGGNSSRSVSSWANTTLRRGRARIWRRIRRFFLALGVRIQVVAGPLPDVVQPVQSPAKRVLGDPLRRGHLQDFEEQGHRPTGVRIAEVLGRGS